jgi:hypothetical protein
MSNPWQQVFEEHREQINADYIAEKYGQHKSDDSEETQALYDLRNKMKNMGKDAVIAYLKRSKMSPERKARLARSLGVSIVGEEFATEGAAGLIRAGLAAGTALAGIKVGQEAQKVVDKVKTQNVEKEKRIRQILGKEEFENIEEKITAKTDIGTAIRDFQGSTDSRLAGRSKEERRKAAIAAVLQARRKAEKANEEVELQEEAKILVRVTKEDGSIFQKKIPASALQDYRKRYKTVVVVGSAEGGGGAAKKEAGSNVNEAAKRWWDDDGDGVGYEKGEVSGSFKKKKKKVKKEEYSDWRSESPDLAEATKAQKSVEGKAHASYEGEDKKKRKKNANESECSCSHEVKESAEVLAQELGAELVDIKEFVGQLIKSGVKAFIRPKPIVVPQRVVPFTRPVKPGPLVPGTPSPAPVPAPKPGKPEPEPKTPQKPGTKPPKAPPATPPKTTPSTTGKGTKSVTVPSNQSNIQQQPSPTVTQTPTKTGPVPGGKPSGKGSPTRLPDCPQWMKDKGLCPPIPGAKIFDPTAPASTLKV